MAFSGKQEWFRRQRRGAGGSPCGEGRLAGLQGGLHVVRNRRRGAGTVQGVPPALRCPQVRK